MNAVAMPGTETPMIPDGHADTPMSACQSAIDGIAADQNLDRSDVSKLVAYIRAKGAIHEQLPGALRQACSRLKRLRTQASRVPQIESRASEAAAALTRAREALQPGSEFSLEVVDRAFNDARAASRQHRDMAPGIIASICAYQAAVAAIMQDPKRAADLYARAATTPGLALAAQWQHQFERAAVLDELGRDYGDNAALREAAKLYENTVLPLAPRSVRPQDWSATQYRLGHALGILGQRGRGTRLLGSAVAAFRNALQEQGPEQSAPDWAATQHGLGNALGILAQRQGDTDMLESAIAALERAVEVRSREQQPYDWALTRYHLGTALLTWGQLARDTAALGHSIEAYKQVLQVWTRERAPLDWARVQNSLGAALRVRGEQGGDPRELQQAVAACRSALEVWSREHTPGEWAMLQNNLGAALHRLGERENDTQLLSEAVTAYANALQALRREDAPTTWAMTTANLGDARRGLAERLRDAGLAQQAVSDFEAVARIFHDASHAQYYELAKERLAIARQLATELGT